MKAIKTIITCAILLISLGVNSQDSKMKENQDFELTISNGKKELHKTYSSFKEIQKDKAIKEMGININKFITYTNGSFQMTTKSGTSKIQIITNNLNPPISNEFTITKTNSEGEVINIKIKKKKIE